MTHFSPSVPSLGMTRPTPPNPSESNNSELLNDYCEKAIAWGTSTDVFNGSLAEDDLARYSTYELCKARSERGSLPVSRWLVLWLTARSAPDLFSTLGDEPEQEISNGQ